MKSIPRQLCYAEFPSRNSRHNNPEVPPRSILIIGIGERAILHRVASGPTIKKGKLQGGAIPEWWNE